MPWCPKCKNEYREGIQVCADCGSPLVEQLTEENPSLTEASGFTPEEEELDLHEESRFEMDDEEQSSQETEQEAAIPLYQDSTVQAEENKSSGWTLLLVGTVGIVIVILGIAGVLPLHIGNPYLFYGVMSAVFILFLVMGVVSMKNAKLFAKKAESENSLRSTMLDWCRESMKAEELDASITGLEDATEEVRYFRRTQKMKELLNHQFVNLDQGFLDHFIDEEIYDLIFTHSEDEQ